MPSKITSPVVFRLPNGIIQIIQRRISGKRSHWKTVGEYLRDRVIYDLTRPHGRKKDQRAGERDKNV